MANNTPALRKRQQIENANKTMFLWVAIAAAIVGVAAVLSISLFNNITARQNVISAKNDTVSTLKKNIKTAETLKKETRVLNTNEALLETQRLDGTEPLSVILDALPSTANSSALGASMQQRLLLVDGVTLESLVVDPISGVEDNGEDPGDSDSRIALKFTVSAQSNQEEMLFQVLRNMERSIRGINLTTITIEQQGGGGRITLSAEGEAYYQPATKVELGEKSV